MSITNYPAIPTNDYELRGYLSRLVQYFPGSITINSVLLGKGTHTIGWYRPKTERIMVSSAIDTRLQFLSTALHELSHAYGYQTGTAYGHSKAWYKVNNDAIARAGLSSVLTASRCHDGIFKPVTSKPIAKSIVQPLTPQYVKFCQSKSLDPNSTTAKVLYKVNK